MHTGCGNPREGMRAVGFDFSTWFFRKKLEARVVLDRESVTVHRVHAHHAVSVVPGSERLRAVKAPEGAPLSFCSKHRRCRWTSVMPRSAPAATGIMRTGAITTAGSRIRDCRRGPHSGEWRAGRGRRVTERPIPVRSNDRSGADQRETGGVGASATAEPTICLSQARAVRTMWSRSSWRGAQPSTWRIASALATSRGGSPARRVSSRRTSLVPETRSTASSTSRTLKPLP